MSANPAGKELYRLGGLAIIVSGIFVAAGAIGTNYLISQNNSTSPIGYLYYVSNHAALLDLSAAVALFGVILLIPGLVALGFLLKDRSTGYAFIGGVIGLAGSIGYLANAGSLFFLVDRASAYAQCTACLQIAYTEALGSQSFTYGFQLSYLLISIAVGILSLAVARTEFGMARNTGLATAVLGVFESIGFISSTTFFDSSTYDPGVRTLVNGAVFYAGVLGLVLFVVWTLMMGRGLLNRAKNLNR